MENKNNPKNSSHKRPDVTGGVSFVGGTIAGVTAGSVFAPEAHAAEVQDDESAELHTMPSNHYESPVHDVSAVHDTEPEPEVIAEANTETETYTDSTNTDSTNTDDIPEPADGEDNTDGIEVIDYGTVTLDDASQMDIAVVNIDGQEATVIDQNHDGIADLLSSDIDGNGVIDENESMNIEDDNIAMSTFQPEFPTEPQEDIEFAMNNDDYINDANVDEYMA